MKFEEKLKRFKREQIGFLVKSKEIADELAKVFDKEKMKPRLPSKDGIMNEIWNHAKEKSYVTYNYYKNENKLSGGTSGYYTKKIELLNITIEELKEYLKDSQTVITITSDGNHRVTAETNGYSAEALCCPTDTFSLTKGSHIALQRLLEKLDEDTIEELGDLSDEPEGFHVGDIVEIMGTDTYFLKESIGLQGVILKDIKEEYQRYLVKLPIDIRGGNEYFYDDLKLIRRVNV